MLHRLIAALMRLLRAVVGGGNKEAGQMKDECAGGGNGDGKKPPEDLEDGHNYPPPHDDGDEGPKEDITFRDGVVEVNIKSDFEGEITMNEATKKAVDDLKAACDTFLGDPSKTAQLRSAMNAVGATEEMGGSTSGSDSPGTQSPGTGGGRPPFVTVNVNVTQGTDE